MANTVSPILADLSQDIAGAIPLELILLWNTSDKKTEKHAQLLDDYTKTGTVVSSDSAGLSKLSQERTLFEVMKLVSEPKEVIYGFGKAVGGEAIGLWIADNTQMFYPDTISTKLVLEAMICAQLEIKENLVVQLGLGIHHGTFIEIGEGLYGKDALFVEELAESHTQGGEIVVTESVKRKVRSAFPKKFSCHPSYPKSYHLDFSGDLFQHAKDTGSVYPYPFDASFYAFLKSYDSLSENDVKIQYDKLSQHGVVLLLKIKHNKRRFLLEQLTDYIVANTYINQTVKKFANAQLVKSNGDLAICVLKNEQEAIELAKKLFEVLRNNKFSLNIALTKGEVLLFPMQTGFEIAGGPVNVASKLAEDSGEINKILLEASIQTKEGKVPFVFTISKVAIRGKYI